MNVPAIAVVMPVYNRASSVGPAIESVLAQDLADFELIVVDDASSDGTAAKVESYRDPRIRLLRQDRNGGANVARNRGVREAAAPLIAFLDSDDLFLPHKLGFLVRFFAARADVDVLIDSFELVFPLAMGKRTIQRTNPVLNSSAEVEQALFDRTVFKATPAMSARKAAIEQVGMFDETLKRRQDFDLALRLARSARCVTTDAVLWTKQWSADAISAMDSTFVAATLDLCERHPQYLAEPTYRTGLARDVARHFVRLGSKGKLGVAVDDAKTLTRAFGARTFAGLVTQGFGEIAKRLREARAAR